MANNAIFILSSLLLAGLLIGASQLQKMSSSDVYQAPSTVGTYQQQMVTATVPAPARKPTAAVLSAPKPTPSTSPRPQIQRRLYDGEDD